MIERGTWVEGVTPGGTFVSGKVFGHSFPPDRFLFVWSQDRAWNLAPMCATICARRNDNGRSNE